MSTKFLNNNEENDSQKERKEWKESRRSYDPRIKTLDKYENPQAQRQALVEKTKAAQEESRAELHEAAAIADSKYASERAKQAAVNRATRLAKEKKRQAYKARVKAEKEQLRLTNPANEINDQQRIYLYARYHKCKHGYAYNNIRHLKDSATKEKEIYCDHEECVIESCDPDLKCMACGTYFDSVCINTKCECKSFICGRCKRHSYYYTYAGQLVQQGYDKHSYGRAKVAVTVDRKDEMADDMEQILKMMVEKARATQERYKKGRKAFRAALRAQRPLTYSEMLTQKVKFVKEGVKEFNEVVEEICKDDPKIVETQPQGGMVSRVSESATSVIESIKTRLRSVKETLTTGFAKLKKKIKERALTNYFCDLISQVISTIKYYINIMLDYMMGMNPITIGRFFFSEKSLANIAVFGTEVAYMIKQAEDRSKTEFELAYEKNKENPTLENLGVLTTVIRGIWFDKELKLSEKLAKIGKAGIFGSYSSSELLSQETVREFLHLGDDYLDLQDEEDETESNGVCTINKSALEREIKKMAQERLEERKKRERDDSEFFLKSTTPQSGVSDFFKTILDLIANFPSKFSKAGRIAVDFFKQINPLLIGVNTTSSILNHTNRLSRWLMGKIFGTADTKTWIQIELKDKESPLHKMTVEYISYNHIIANSEIGTNTTEIRSNFYKYTAEADKLAQETEHFDYHYLQWKNVLEKGFDKPPLATPREFEPTVLYLYGGPGIGKSTFWKVIAAPVLGLDDPETLMEKIETMTHTWNGASEYQVGMSSKEVILFDDFGQDRLKNEQQLNVIALATNAPFPIDSPSITGPEIKGMMANPSVLVLCSNLLTTQTVDQLSCPNAMERRVDLGFECLARFDPKNPDAQILRVKQCPRYSQMVNSTMSLSQARSLFYVIHKKKRMDFTRIKKVVSVEAARGVATAVPKFTPSTALAESEVWKSNGNLEADFQEVFGMRATAPQSGLYDGMKAVFSELLITGAAISFPVSYITTYYTLMGALALTYFKVAGCDFGWKWVWSLVKMCLVAMTGTVVAFAILKTMVTGTDQESGTTKTAKAEKRKVTVPEGGSHELNILFKRATGSIRIVETGCTLNVIFIGGHYILAPMHIFQDLTTGEVIPEGSEVQIVKSTWNGVSRKFSFSSSRLIRLTGNVDARFASSKLREDVCLYKLDEKKFSAEKNIVKHFWDGDFDPVNFEVERIDFEGWNIYGEYDGEFTISSGKILHSSIRTARLENGVAVFLVCAEADYPNRDRSCGSIVRLKRQEAPILGIHVARGERKDNHSYFHFVTAKVLQAAMDNDGVNDVRVDEIGFIPSTPEAGCVVFPEECILQQEGTIAKTVFQPTKTDLQKSTVSGCLGEVLTEPSVLSYTDKRLDPKYASFEKFYTKLFSGYKVQKGCFENEDLEIARRSMIDDVASIQAASFVPTVQLNLLEAINGLKYIPDNTRMDMTTSCGYPYTSRGLTKNDLFVEEDGQLLPCCTIGDDFRKAKDLLAVGVVPYLPFTLTLKDERVKISKIVEPKTRIFACANVVHFLIMRSYFYSYIMQIYHAPMNKAWCVPSLDRISLDWHDMSAHMMEVGTDGFDFDFSFFDRTLQHNLLYAGVEVMLTGQQIPLCERNTLIEMICSPYMVWNNRLFRSSGVLMSGSLITYALNCVVNELMHRSAWVSIMRKAKPELSGIRFYKKYTRGMRGGDDTITTVHPQVLPYFNGITVAEYLRSKGMVVTSSDKSADIVASQHYFDLSFLKNKTALSRGYYVPFPDLDSLIQSMYWVRLNKYNNNIVTATESNVICSLRGVFFHGKSKYNTILRKIKEADARLNLPEYEELATIWKRYFKFPGAHADYAVRERDEDLLTQTVIPNKNRLGLTEGEVEQLEKMETRITVAQVGQAPAPIDKEKMETVSIDTAPVSTEIGAVPTDTINNEDNQTSSKTEKVQVGTTVQDSNNSVSLTVKTGAITTSSRSMRAEAFLNDVNWDLKKLEMKFTQVGEATWDITHTVGTELYKAVLPREFLVTPAQKSPFDVTKLWRCESILVKVVLKASPFYAGSTVMGFTPFDYTPSYKRIINMGGLIQKVSQDESLEFVVPFRHKKGFIDVAHEDLGTFSIHVLSPLTTGQSNPTSITMTVYAAINNSEFKIPDIVPQAEYSSWKLDRKLKMVVTMPQSGIIGQQQRLVSCDINSKVTEMPGTMMCAGVGTLGSVRVSHFQDAPSDLVQLRKRWKLAFRRTLEMHPESYNDFRVGMKDLYLQAMAGLEDIFGLMRGSVNVRAVLRERQPSNVPVRGLIYFTMNDYVPVSQEIPSTPGFQEFDSQNVGQVAIPWLRRTFTDFSPSSDEDEALGYLHVMVINESIADTPSCVLEVFVSVGDDFHAGVFLGSPEAAYKTNYFQWTLQQGPLVPNVPVVPLRKTKPQADVIQFIDRALETTLPLVEKASELGALLDAPMLTVQPAPIMPRKIPYSIASDLPQYLERVMCLNHNGLSLPDSECFGSQSMETDIHNLLTETKSLANRLQWNASAAAGEELGTFLTGPSGELAEGNLHEVLPSTFNFWTGSTIFIFDIIASQMHRGQLLFVYTPNNVDNVSYTDATQTYFATYDLAEGRGTVKIECPYLSDIPYRRIVSSGEPWTNENRGGKLSVFIQNPLRSTQTVSPNVEVIVYKSYGKDFRMGAYGVNTI